MSDNKTLLIDLHYFPCIEAFCLFSKFNRIAFEAKEHFNKQTYRNRCYILSANGILPLVVPIRHKLKKMDIDKLEIDYSQKWQKQHIKALESAYNKSPFFEHYYDRFLRILEDKPVRLFELNFELLTICLDILQMNIDIGTTTEYMDTLDKTSILDVRNNIIPKVSFTYRRYYKPEPYFQMFGKGFAANLSVLDLIFSEGPNSMSVIKNSCQ